MPKEAHTKAAEHHDNAAKSHRKAADHHSKGEHGKGREESSKAKLIPRPRASTRIWRTARASPRSRSRERVSEAASSGLAFFALTFLRDRDGAEAPAREWRGPLVQRVGVLIRERRMTERPELPEVPEHIDQAVRSIAQLHSEHHGRTKAAQRLVNQISAAIARPMFVGLLAVGVTAWIAANLIATALWGRAIDPPAFPWLKGRSISLAVHRHAGAGRPET